MDRSEKVRELIRKKLDEGFDFSNEKGRLEMFRQWCFEEENKKEGFEGNKHRTLFTEQIKKVCKERNVDPTTFGLQRPKVSFTPPASSDKIDSTITPKPKDSSGQTSQSSGQTSQQSTAQPKPPPAIVDENLVRITWKTMFNLIRIKFKKWEELDEEEIDALGKAWLPIFQKYIEKNWLFWGVPLTVTLGVFMSRISKGEAKEESKTEEEKKSTESVNDKDYQKWKEEQDKKNRA